MAQQKRKTTNTTKNTKKKVNKSTKKGFIKDFVINKQLTAVILFAVSILWFCLSVIDVSNAFCVSANGYTASIIRSNFSAGIPLF